jgi:hypothetical protein
MRTGGFSLALRDDPGLFHVDKEAGVTLLTPATTPLSDDGPWRHMAGFRATGERMNVPRRDDACRTIEARIVRLEPPLCRTGSIG